MVPLRDGTLTNILRAIDVPPKVCNLVPQVIQACQSCRPWNKPGQANKFTHSLALKFHEEMQFDLVLYHSQLGPGLGGAHGIPLAHLIGCNIRWSACVKSSSKTIRDLLDCMNNVSVHVFGNMSTLTLDGERGVKGKEIDDLAMYNQMTMKCKSPKQTKWLAGRHNALI